MGQDDLRSVLSKLPQYSGLGDLLVGTSTGDDAAVLRIDQNRAIVQTLDFFTPMVDDPATFGAVVAANAASDIYAMGAQPILGLAIVEFPHDKLPLSVLEEILQGGAAKANEAGFPVAGGHTIIGDVPKYGLAVTGIAEPSRVVRNSTASPGDLIYLTKPIGNGILISGYRAHRVGRLKRLVHRTEPDFQTPIEWMLKLNRDAAAAMLEAGASAATDVTGYGLVGHLLEMTGGSKTGARIRMSDVPVLDGSREWLAKGYVPAGSLRNAEAFRQRVRSEVSDSDFTILCDAQTSGGLLISISQSKKTALENAFAARQVFFRHIGEFTDAEAGVTILSS